jgi:hypothetical protein
MKTEDAFVTELLHTDTAVLFAALYVFAAFPYRILANYCSWLHIDSIPT